MEAAELILLLLLLLLLLLCSAPSAAAQNNNSIIPVASELKPGSNSSVWLSESGTFAFGFYKTPGGYVVCIFLASISEKTVVWTARKTDPVLPGNVISLSIEVDNLSLYDIRNDGIYRYYDIVTLVKDIAGASMLDNGNFVVYNSVGSVIWQSFDDPNDTLLPGQYLPTGQELVSRVSTTDLAGGKFRLKMQADGNLVQYPVGSPDSSDNAYYGSDTSGAGKNLSLNLENNGHLYLYDGNFSYFDITSKGKAREGSIYMARVDPDGIFRLYNGWLGGEGNWTVIWSSTQDRCVPKGLCGDNSYCTYGDENVTCICLPGFGDGCKNVFDVGDCRKNNPNVKYEMKIMENVLWQDNYYDFVNDTISIQECGGLCLNDCDCVVALYNSGLCRKQKSPMRYGRRSVGVSNIAIVRVALSKPAPPLEAPNGSVSRKGLTGSVKWRYRVLKYVIIGVSIGVAALLISSYIIYYLKNKRGLCSHDEESKEIVNNFVLNHGSLALKRYSYREIRKITKSFTEKLGQGGYGIVYKGKLHDARLVAVKLLTKTNSNGDEFLNEVASISRTSHVNIVNLLGFCFEGKKRALVYEFMPNKSLDKYIYKRGSVEAECCLEWKRLYEIAVGVARGLEYLHKGCNTRIVHFDIKPQNILLDEDFCPKISDFGLAKLCKKKQSVISMLGTRGTIGYIAPEVFSRNFGQVSHKSDVYSYGMMLLQMVEARTNAETKSFQSGEDYFLEKVYEHVLVQNEKIYALMTEEEEEVVRKMLMVGFWCIQTAPSDRPSMNKVMDMLEGNVESIQTAPLPFLLSSPKPEFSGLQLPVIVETQSCSEG